MKAIVVGTGRCGSNSMAQWLARCGLKVAMEPFAEIAACANYWYMKHLRVDASPRMDIIRHMMRMYDRYDVIVDNNLSYCSLRMYAYGVVDRVIWLVRNPWDTVCSLVKWKWYRDPEDIRPDDVFANTRVDWTDLGVPEWGSCTKIEKCAHYWTQLNGLLCHDLSLLETNYYLSRVRLEDWSALTATKLISFLGASMPDDWRLPHANRAETLADAAPPPEPTEENIATVERICKPTQELLYPEGVRHYIKEVSCAPSS